MAAVSEGVTQFGSIFGKGQNLRNSTHREPVYFNEAASTIFDGPLFQPKSVKGLSEGDPGYELLLERERAYLQQEIANLEQNLVVQTGGLLNESEKSVLNQTKSQSTATPQSGALQQKVLIKEEIQSVEKVSERESEKKYKSSQEVYFSSESEGSEYGGSQSKKKKGTRSRPNANVGVKLEHVDLTDDSKPVIQIAKWADEEKLLYLKLVKRYGQCFKKFYKKFPTKTNAQVRNFWMNHKFTGMCLLKNSERGIRARNKTNFISDKISKKSKRVFKDGKTLFVIFKSFKTAQEPVPPTKQKQKKLEIDHQNEPIKTTQDTATAVKQKIKKLDIEPYYESIKTTQDPATAVKQKTKKLEIDNQNETYKTKTTLDQSTSFKLKIKKLDIEPYYEPIKTTQDPAIAAKQKVKKQEIDCENEVLIFKPIARKQKEIESDAVSIKSKHRRRESSVNDAKSIKQKIRSKKDIDNDAISSKSRSRKRRDMDSDDKRKSLKIKHRRRHEIESSDSENDVQFRIKKYDSKRILSGKQSKLKFK